MLFNASLTVFFFSITTLYGYCFCKRVENTLFCLFFGHNASLHALCKKDSSYSTDVSTREAPPSKIVHIPLASRGQIQMV